MVKACGLHLLSSTWKDSPLSIVRPDLTDRKAKAVS